MSMQCHQLLLLLHTHHLSTAINQVLLLRGDVGGRIFYTGLLT